LKLWQNEHEVCAQVVDRAWQIMDEWVTANTMHSPLRQQQEIGHAAVTHPPAAFQEQMLVPGPIELILWQRPLPSRDKCNIDASFSPVQNHTGIGICLRDEKAPIC